MIIKTENTYITRAEDNGISCCTENGYFAFFQRYNRKEEEADLNSHKIKRK